MGPIRYPCQDPIGLVPELCEPKHCYQDQGWQRALRRVSVGAQAA